MIIYNLNAILLLWLEYMLMFIINDTKYAFNIKKSLYEFGKDYKYLASYLMSINLISRVEIEQ